MSYITSFGKKVKPINRNLIVKYPQEHKENSSSLIIRTDVNRNLATIIRRAGDIKNACLLNTNTSKVLTRKMTDAKFKQKCLDRSDKLEDSTFIINEGEIAALFNEENRIKPIGRKYLVRRLIDTEILSSGIIIPYGAFSKDQTLWVEMEDWGIPNVNDQFKNKTLCRGDRMLLNGWKQSYIEIGNSGDNGYYLIVDEDDVVLIDYPGEKDSTFLKEDNIIPDPFNLKLS